MLKTRLMKAAFGAIHRSGAAALMQRSWGGKGVIFCLHHVTPNGGHMPGFAPNTHLEITPEFLDEFIKHVRHRGYDIVPIEEVSHRLNGATSRNRFAVFTLDDGFLDNLEHAFPVFERNECPFTIYVAPRITDGTCEIWWRGLEAIIAENPSLDIAGPILPFAAETRTEAQKWAAWHTLAPRLQAMDEYRQREWITIQAKRFGHDLAAYCRSVAMTWDQLRALSLHRLATIGAHTLNHYNLKKLPAADAEREVEASRLRIEQELQKPVRHFAYPYGNRDAAGLREFGLAKIAGYETAVVTRLGPLHDAHAHHLHALPRIMVSGRYQDLRYIDALLSGVPSRLSNGFQALNVR